MNHDQIPSHRPETPLLDQINQPSDLRQFSPEQLSAVAAELRHYLLYAAGQSGGHFGANLGVVELTIALHYVLDTPHDRLVWDVGHQAYAHKVLTGRRDQLVTIRGQHGLTAFPTRHESEYDTFGVGHSSTSISAGLGMALAARYQQQPRRVACVIGDGAMTAGMAFEAINDAVQQQADLLVILNDNDMSISASTGGLSRHLAGIWQGKQCILLNEDGQPVVCPRPEWQFKARQPVAPARSNAGSGEDAQSLFTALGFDYFGPVDGHDLTTLIPLLDRLKDRPGPRLLHVYTTKGKGYQPAELDPIGFHAIARQAAASAARLVDMNADQAQAEQPRPRKYSDVFGDWLCQLAQADQHMVAITPAMCEGSGMVRFAREYPERFFDVAIAEQHAVTLAAGMACEGLKPVVAIYSTFLQRAYDQVMHDVSLQNLDVTFGIDRAGLVGEDGPTHAGVFDYAYLRTLPNMLIAAPKDERECWQLLQTAYQHPGPAAVRYPRGTGPGSVLPNDLDTLPIGQAEWLTTASAASPARLAILAFGSMVAPAQQLLRQLVPLLQAQGIGVSLLNMRFIKPLDQAALSSLLRDHGYWVTLEEHALAGGAGSAVNEWLLMQYGRTMPAVLNIGIPDQYVEHAGHSQQLAALKLDAAGLQEQILQWLPLARSSPARSGLTNYQGQPVLREGRAV